MFRPLISPEFSAQGYAPGRWKWRCRGQQRQAAPQGLLLVSPPEPVLVTGLHGGGCRSVRRRQERLAHWRAWHASGVRTIDELCNLCPIPCRRDSSCVQTLLCNKLKRACVDAGRLPGDLTAAGALGELCGFHVGFHDDGCGPRAPCQPGLAALPRAASKPIDTVSCLPSEARRLAEPWRHSFGS